MFFILCQYYFILKNTCFHYIFLYISYDLFFSCILFWIVIFIDVTVHAYVPSNGICHGFAFKYGKFLLPPRFLTALLLPKVPPREQ